jgi:hypothetical protein
MSLEQAFQQPRTTIAALSDADGPPPAGGHQGVTATGPAMVVDLLPYPAHFANPSAAQIDPQGTGWERSISRRPGRAPSKRKCSRRRRHDARRFAFSLTILRRAGHTAPTRWSMKAGNRERRSSCRTA